VTISFRDTHMRRTWNNHWGRRRTDDVFRVWWH